jgi:hypothetical protein
MPDPNVETPAANPPVDGSATDAEAILKSLNMTPEQVKSLAGRLGNTMQELEALKKAQVEAEEKKLAETNQYKELADRKTKEVEALTAKAKRADELETVTSKLLKAQAEGLDATVADAIITNGNYTLEEKIEKISALKKAAPQKNAPASEPPSFDGYATPDDFFKAIESDIKRQAELAVTNPTAFEKFTLWKKGR